MFFFNVGYINDLNLKQLQENYTTTATYNSYHEIFESIACLHKISIKIAALFQSSAHTKTILKILRAIISENANPHTGSSRIPKSPMSRDNIHDI